MGWILVCACALLDSGANDLSLDDHYDLFEYNTITRQAGMGDFFQVVMWNWDPKDRMYHAQAYIVIAPEQGLTVPPLRRRGLTERYVLVVYDLRIHRIRRVYAAGAVTTYTGYDPELTDRRDYPQAKRIPLSQAVPWRPSRSVLKQN